MAITFKLIQRLAPNFQDMLTTKGYIGVRKYLTTTVVLATLSYLSVSELLVLKLSHFLKFWVLNLIREKISIKLSGYLYHKMAVFSFRY